VEGVPAGGVSGTGALGAGAGAGFAASGSLSGPFCPHAQSATAAARARARIMPGIMTESEFHRAADALIARIESTLENEEGVDVDVEAGILTLTFGDSSRVIVNRQAPNREIWVAARSGGFHFAWRDGEWRDTRSGDELFASLDRVIAAQGGVDARWK
jgi:CyaY protein